MRVELTALTQSLIESPKNIEKKEVTADNSRENQPAEETLHFIPSPLGSSGTYSPSSLRAAVDYYAKFLTVAENNLAAANHPPTIPKTLLDRLNGIRTA
jgi:hypothetical protein